MAYSGPASLPAKALLSRAADAAVGQVEERSSITVAVPDIFAAPQGVRGHVEHARRRSPFSGGPFRHLACLLAVLTAAASLVWVALFGCYLSLFAVGQTFLSFQWDILLRKLGSCASSFVRGALVLEVWPRWELASPASPAPSSSC